MQEGGSLLLSCFGWRLLQRRVARKSHEQAHQKDVENWRQCIFRCRCKIIVKNGGVKNGGVKNGGVHIEMQI